MLAKLFKADDGRQLVTVDFVRETPDGSYQVRGLTYGLEATFEVRIPTNFKFDQAIVLIPLSVIFADTKQPAVLTAEEQDAVYQAATEACVG